MKSRTDSHAVVTRSNRVGGYALSIAVVPTLLAPGAAALMRKDFAMQPDVVLVGTALSDAGAALDREIASGRLKVAQHAPVANSYDVVFDRTPKRSTLLRVPLVHRKAAMAGIVESNEEIALALGGHEF